VDRALVPQLAIGPCFGRPNVVECEHAAEGSHDLLVGAGLSVVQSVPETDNVSLERKEFGGEGVFEALPEKRSLDDFFRARIRAARKDGWQMWQIKSKQKIRARCDAM